MKELFEHMMLPYNLPMTVAMGVLFLYWIIVLFGGMAVDAFDVDLDVDTDLDAEVDGSNLFHGLLGGTLRFVNADAIPLTIVLSLVILFTWAAQILSNYYLNAGHSMWLGFLLLLGSFIAASVATKAVTQPLRPLMIRLKKAEDTKPVIGEVGIVRSLTLSEKIGQVEVHRDNGAPALLTCRLSEGAAELPRGSEVVIVSYDEAEGSYLATSLFDSSK
ncbi:hypothetical protein [Haloferula helveola]|uniref:hypothetical protein n=1 Tax=Haloferula helveola TaxID=490095 RepID=UPI0030B1234E